MGRLAIGVQMTGMAKRYHTHKGSLVVGHVCVLVPKNNNVGPWEADVVARRKETPKGDE